MKRRRETSRVCDRVKPSLLSATIALLRDAPERVVVGDRCPLISRRRDPQRLLHPPVDVQKHIAITISYFSWASLDTTVFATGEGSIAPQGPPLLQERPSGTSFSTEVESTQSQAYGVYIVSYNRTEFLLTVASVWSPFYGLRTFFAPAVAFVFAAGVATYYFTLAAKREEGFGEALTEARGGLGSGKATLLRDRRTLEVSPEHVGVCRGRDQY